MYKNKKYTYLGNFLWLRETSPGVFSLDLILPQNKNWTLGESIDVLVSGYTFVGDLRWLEPQFISFIEKQMSKNYVEGTDPKIKEIQKDVKKYISLFRKEQLKNNSSKSNILEESKIKVEDLPF